MAEPSTRKPTKKALQLQKNVNSRVKASDKPADDEASIPVVADAKPARTKAAKQASAATVEAAQAAPVAEAKAKRVKKEKVVRDSFTMPKSDYEKIAALKQKCLEAGVSVKKSELLRAGLLLLDSATTKRLVAAISAVETVKTGRPAQS